MPFKTYQLKTGKHRALLILGMAICLIAALFSVKWSLGHLISVRAEQKEVADLSSRLAPHDPQTHYSSAVLHEKSFVPGDLEKAVKEFEEAAALSPNDYLLWLALGRARDRSGDALAAELALRRAVELAPNYADPHWTLGNNLLRQGKSAEAFQEIRRSALAGDRYILPAMATAWQIFGGDITAVRNNIGGSPKLNAFLAVFLIKQERFDEGFEILNALSPEMKSGDFRPQTLEAYDAFIGAKRFRYARLLKSWLDGQSDGEVFGIITDAGFEDNSKKEKADFFDRRIGDGAQPLVGFDDRIKRSGNLSLVMIFNSPDGQDFRPISQPVVVEGGRSYRFEGFYKTDLKTLSTLRWEVLNAADSSLIVATDALEQNTDWTKFTAEFTAPANSEAVVINLARIKCSSTICPTTGKIWFDDFSIQAK